MEPNQIIAQTQTWINQVVVGCNFCPFAKREIERDSIRYVVSHANDAETALAVLLDECRLLDQDPEIETTLLIYPAAFSNFFDYLNLLEVGNVLLKKQEYEGVYQLASFHPDYQFADTNSDDASNYTNRSPYPMLHLLREESVEKAIALHPDPDAIPETNIEKARSLGVDYFRKILSPN